MLKLQFKDQRQAAIWLSDERFTIGQDQKNNLSLRDAGVAAFHAEIRREGNQFFIADTGTNGTQVNGERISGRYQLRAGDNIKLANVEFELVSPKTAATAAGPRHDWSIQAITGELKGQRFPIVGSMTLGRSTGCEICIHDDKISRRHSELQLKDGALRLKDLGSANGTFVNRKKIKEVALASGDQIHFDAVTFLVIGPTKVEALPEQDEEEVTIFSIAPIEKPTNVTPIGKAPQQQSIKIDPTIDRQVSMAGSTENHSSRLIIIAAAIAIAIAAGAGYWFFLK